MGHSVSARAVPASPAGHQLGALKISIDWLIWWIALTALEFAQYSQTIALYSFTAMVLIYFAKRPGVALSAIYYGNIQWLVVFLYVLSVLWSPVPDFSFRLALETALSFAAALALARGMPPGSMMTVLMCALFIPTLASIADPKMQMNAGVLAMVGVFGSKNQFGLTQALLIMTSLWIVGDRSRSPLTRAFAAVGLLTAIYMSVVARSVDSWAIAVGAIGCGYMALKLNWFPKRWRLPIFWGTTGFVCLGLLFLFLIADDLFGSFLGVFGKNATLTGRTLIWERARDVWNQNPTLGMGLGGFWVWGNPYAEELWAQFQPGRTGINFHNMWYEMGVQFGYVGVALMFLIVLVTSVEVVHWVIRSPTMTSCFFFSLLIFTEIRMFLESELFGQYALMSMLFVATWSYARHANRQAMVDRLASLAQRQVSNFVNGEFGPQRVVRRSRQV